jgi:hypothetical protein
VSLLNRLSFSTAQLLDDILAKTCKSYGKSGRLVFLRGVYVVNVDPILQFRVSLDDTSRPFL